MIVHVVRQRRATVMFVGVMLGMTLPSQTILWPAYHYSVHLWAAALQPLLFPQEQNLVLPSWKWNNWRNNWFVSRDLALFSANVNCACAYVRCLAYSCHKLAGIHISTVRRATVEMDYDVWAKGSNQLSWSVLCTALFWNEFRMCFILTLLWRLGKVSRSSKNCIVIHSFMSNGISSQR